jgi:hypothetical protein
MPGFLGGSGASSGGTGGEIRFPKEFIDPVTKLRVSEPENLIDTDFEYGLQPTKWETVELINNTPSFFSKSGDTTIPGIVAVTTNAGTREITVTTGLAHGLAVGIPINVQGSKSVTADGSYIINSIPDPKTFTYLCRDNQEDTSAIEDLYTSIITGEFFQGSQLRISEAEGIVTDAEPISTLTVTTSSAHGFGPNTPFYFLNLNSTISQEFEAANTAAKSFDSSNSATAQTFDGSNTLSTLNIDWSNSATVGGTVSTVSGTNTAANTVTVAHSTENFAGLPLGQPLYYNVAASLGYFFNNPRGVVFLKTVDDLDVNSSTFQLSATPDGATITLQSNLSGTFQIANQARGFAGNNLNPATQTVLNVLRADAFGFEGANDQAIGGNGISTVTSYSGSLVNVSTVAAAGLDYYQGAMLRYTTTGSAASGLVANGTYFVDSFFSTGTDTFAMTVKALPTDENPISVTGGTGTQSFTRIGVSLDRNIVHIRNSFFTEKDMLEYEFPVGGAFEADSEKVFYFVATAYDSHNYDLNPVAESFITATGGSVVQTVTYASRPYTVHRFTTEGTFSLDVTDAGTFSQDLKFTIEGSSSFGGATTEGTRVTDQETITVVVGSGGRVDVAYPQDNGTNDIPFANIHPIPVEATGGSISDITIDGDGYRVHVFTSTGSSTFGVQSLGNITDDFDYLIVAGGGGGGGSAGGGASGAGGGAGGLLNGITTLTIQDYSVVVGTGGSSTGSDSDVRGGDGANSTAFGLTSIGGGGGGSREPGNGQGATGGSGGGEGSQNTTSPGFGLGTSGQGNNGGANGFSGNVSADNASGGGGGAGGVGQNGLDNSRGGNGGIGLDFSSTFTSAFGDNGFFAGGGASGRPGEQAGDQGTGGTGGGGNGGNTTGQAGAANTGGGGGGAGADGRPGGGGSGIIIIRYPTTPPSEGGD